MAAGLGFKDFTTGEVLTAADVDGYLMQGIWVFASTAARNAAVTSPSEGNFAFTKDTNSLWYYDGAAWVASGATGDIEGVTAGVGISGGGTSGTVTITNDMATTITASGDIVLGTGSGTYDNLPIGSTGQVLTADTTVSPYKVKWATPSAGGGGKVLQVVSAVITTTANITTTTLTDTNIALAITPTLNTSKVLVMINAYAQQDCSSNDGEFTAQAIIDRGGTTIFDTLAEGFRVFGFPSSAPYYRMTTPLTFLDSPATTSATTYKLQAKVGSTTNGEAIRFQPSSTKSVITLMEIGA